ncbi:MAG: hypothetical protein LUO80_03225 [Methylococcaceae bacterium]|nr:hypothetical protein [Methylococcaceae bacterium]
MIVPRQKQAAKEVLREQGFATHLPAIFRALSGQKPSREDKDKLLAITQGQRRR